CLWINPPADFSTGAKRLRLNPPADFSTGAKRLRLNPPADFGMVGWLGRPASLCGKPDSTGGHPMIEYDASVIQTFANRLYRRAQWIVLYSALEWGAISFGVALIVSGIIQRSAPQFDPSMSLMLGAVGLAVGLLSGKRKTFGLRLQAQMALCQAQVERNLSELLKLRTSV
ncbi:MAG: hypothetical protein ACRD4Q_04335, partial [Candidatus Acidiferrales bacterium]